MIIEALAVGTLSAIVMLACGWLVHRIFVVEPRFREAQRDINKAALQSLGQDRLRPMDVNPNDPRSPHTER